MDTSITNRQGCNYCMRNKVMNTNGTDFTIREYVENGREEHFIQTNTETFSSLDINFCPICGRDLFKK